MLEGEVGCAAHGLDAGGPWGGAIGIEVGMKDNVGGGVQVALGMTALGRLYIHALYKQCALSVVGWVVKKKESVNG